MAIDTPARIAIIGAGPIGLEAALYGRFLGYEVDVFERGKVADNVAKWGHVQMFSPWSMNMSPLGRAAIEAQNPDWACPADNERPTGREFIERYLLPLAQSDLVADGLHEHSAVLKVGRYRLLKGQRIGDAHPADKMFQLFVRRGENEERVHHADIVIDASGTLGNHNSLGGGGLPALGELENSDRIDYCLPDVRGLDHDRFADRHTLVVGNGYSAATNIVALAELAHQHSSTQVTWLTRGADQHAPIGLIDGDQLSARDALARAAIALAASFQSVVDHLTATSIQQIAYNAASDNFQVTLVGKHAKIVQVDRIIANVGYRPDHTIYSGLQVLTRYSSESTTNLPVGSDALRNPEPNFYILGAKSYGRNWQFLISDGLKQICDVFTIIGGRANLDLYELPGAKLGKQVGA